MVIGGGRSKLLSLAHSFVLLMVFVRKKKWIVYTVLGGSLISAILMMILFTPGGDPTRVYYGTDTRLFSIWLGSALAFVWPSTRLKKIFQSKQNGC